MSRIGSSGYAGRPGNNVYTALAFISAAVTAIALGYTLFRFHEMGVL